MIPNYNGYSCRYDKTTNTYSRPPVKVSYPCSTCGSNRPLIPGTLRPGVCCPRQNVDKVAVPGNDKEDKT